MFSPAMVRTAIFGVRNVEKTQEGHIGRAAVALGQSKNLFDSIKQLDCKIAKDATSASNALGKVAQNDVVVNKMGKALKVCSEHVNPLIWASAGLDIIFADDKKEALVQNVAGIGSMRIAEEVMKDSLDTSVDKLLGKIMKNQKINKFVNNTFKNTQDDFLKTVGKGFSPVLKGILFVVGSCVAYDAGKGFGNLLLDKKQES